MRITVLGSSAGGGFPQWNCNCRNCAGLRAGTLRAKARTQSSIFIRPDDGVDGVLFNASPDILEQIRGKPALQPARSLRDSAIAGVVLMDGQIDHATGLFMLRERSLPLPLWCTDPVEEDLSHGNPVLRVLSHYCGVQRQRIAPGRQPVPGARRGRPDASVRCPCRARPHRTRHTATGRCRATTSACWSPIRAAARARSTRRGWG